MEADILKIITEMKWTDRYIRYLRNKEAGLRKLALTDLNEFILDFQHRDHYQKRIFVDLVGKLTIATLDYAKYLPMNFYRTCYINEIEKWINDEPNNPIPYKWSDNFEHNKKAIELAPSDQIALTKFANRLINKISMNQHEIADGFMYQGVPLEDIILINFFEPYIDNIIELKKRTTIKQTLLDLKETAMNHMSSSNNPEISGPQT